jgi:hypothetical protein
LTAVKINAANLPLLHSLLPHQKNTVAQVSHRSHFQNFRKKFKQNPSKQEVPVPGKKWQLAPSQKERPLILYLCTATDGEPPPPPHPKK